MDESEMTGELNLFGWEHLLLLFCTAAAAALLFCYRDRLRGWRHREIPRFVLAALLFLNMAVFYGVFVVKGTYDSVSYTHLDVYKRQPDRMAYRGSPPRIQVSTNTVPM